MTVSLPKNWDGIYFGENTGAEMLFTMSIDELLEGFEAHGVMPEALAANAILDLVNHGETARATELLTAAFRKWPDYQYANLFPILATAREMIRAGCDKALTRTVLKNAMTKTFGGFWEEVEKPAEEEIRV